MGKTGEKPGASTAVKTTPEAVKPQTQEQQGGLTRILLEVENPASAQAIVEGMDLIVNGLRRSANDFFYGNPEKLGKYKTWIAEKIRQEVYGFLSTLNIGEERAKAVLNLYLSSSSDSERKRSGKERVERADMAVECRNDAHGQDACFILADQNAFGVFDGVSAATKGAEAARIAAKRAEEMFVSPRMNQKTPEEIKLAIHDVLVRISKELTDAEAGRETYQTTASVVHIHRGEDGHKKIIVGNVGDSRVYVFHQGKLQQITLDDGGVRALVGKDGDETRAREVQSSLNNIVSPDNLAEDQRKMFAKRNRIWQALGHNYGEKVMPRMHIADVVSGDIVFVSSDGIHDPLTDNEMEAILRKSGGRTSNEIAKAFIGAVEKRNADPNHIRSKPDDMTILVIQVS